MINRDYFKIVEKELQNKQITALIGSRQVGKSTLLEYVYEQVKEKSIFLSFDNVEILNLFENNFKLFIEQYIIPYDIIFIDEIQYSKSGGKNLKFIYDKYKKKIFISGSSSPELSINFLQYLVGRVNIIEIFPIKFNEYVEYVSKEKKILLNKIRTCDELKQLDVEFINYLKYGSYPQVLIKKNPQEKERELKNLVNTYLLKEIKEILNYENLFEYENLLKRLALSDGQIMNKSNISAELEINRVKLNKMLEIFNKTFILKTLNPFMTNKIKELIKSPKIYFQDLGFKNSLINNFNSLELRQDKGFIYESFILNSLIREEINIQFWNLKNEYEIDFVYERNAEIYGFEVKSKLSNTNLTNSLKRFIENYSPKEVYIFNENIDAEIKLNKTKIIFTNYLNIFKIIEELNK